MMYGGLDVHKNFVQACFINDQGAIVQEKKYPTTPHGLQALCAQAQGSHCVLEACSACYPTYDALIEAGIQVHPAHPWKVKAISSAKLKTDKVDAHMLAQLEKAGLIPEAHIPTKQVRDVRQLLQQHITLTQQRTQVKNFIHGLLTRTGVRSPFKNTFCKRSRKWLLNHATGSYQLTLEQSFCRIDLMNTQLEQVDEEIKTQAQKNDDAVLLDTIPGIAELSALLLASEIDDVNRFPNFKSLQSYVGLVPRIHQSGNVSRTGHISKQGRPNMRWALSECALAAIRTSKRFSKVYKKALRENGGSKPKAIVKVECKMLECSYFMLRRRQAYNENA